MAITVINYTIMQARFEKFENTANDKFNNKFKYHRDTWLGVSKNITITCPNHGEFIMSAHQHIVQTYGCPQCADLAKGKWNTLDRDTYFSEIKKTHNNAYTYNTTEYQNTSSILSIVCNVHGMFKQVAGPHRSGQGCPECGAVKSRNTRMVKFDTFLTEARSVHGDKFEYFGDSWFGMEKKTKIKCPDHGMFEQMPRHHVDSNNGCYACALIESGLKRRTPDSEYIEAATKVRPEFTYNGIIRENSKTKLKIVCSKHGAFIKGYHKWISGCGYCPNCKHNRQYSKLEVAWLDSLGIESMIKQYKLPQLPTLTVDGYDPSTNTVYQFHGDFWHGNPNIHNADDINPKTKERYGDAYKRTLRIAEQIRSLGFNLVEQWQTDIT